MHLPVHEGSRGDEWTFPAPEMAAPWRHRVLTPGHAARRIEEDLVSGEYRLVVEEVGPECENLDHGLTTRESSHETWAIHPGDPASARSEISKRQELSRGDWRVETEVTAVMRGDAETLYFEAELIARAGGEEVLRRRWEDRVPRQFV